MNQIWNSDLPDLTLLSHPQTVTVEGGGTGNPPTGYYSYCVEYGFGENTDSPFYLAYTYADYLARCEADDLAKKADLLALATKKLENQWLNTYYNTLELSCLDNVTEAFTYTYTPREYHYTFYYYDQSGHLVKTVPPKGVHPLEASQVDRVINEGTPVKPGHTLPSYYRYDSRDQLAIQESPDGGESRFWYDRAGQLRLSRNEVQAAADAYSYTKYDHLGRVVETGEMESTESRSQLLESIEEPTFPDAQTYNCHDITLTSYDQPLAGKYPAIEQEYLRTRVSWTAMVERDRTDTVFMVYSYDAHED